MTLAPVAGGVPSPNVQVGVPAVDHASVGVVANVSLAPMNRLPVTVGAGITGGAAS